MRIRIGFAVTLALLVVLAHRAALRIVLEPHYDSKIAAENRLVKIERLFGVAVEIKIRVHLYSHY